MGILTLFLILFISWLNEKLIETSISIVFFYIYRPLYEKQYHSNTLERCSFVSTIVFIFVSRVELEISSSILFTIIITFIITTASYLFKDLLDNRFLNKIYEDKIKSLNTKRLEELSESEMYKLMPDIRYDIIEVVYKYLHRDNNMSATIFAYKNHVSERTLFRYLKLVKTTYENMSA